MIGEIIAGTGMWVAIIANLQFMQHLISSDFLKSLVLMVGLTASVVLSPTAGVMIDRHDRRTILIISSLVRCAAPLCMFPALASDSIAWMILSLVILQSANAFYLPTIQAAVPSVVSSEELLQANAVYLNISTLSRIGGTALGGIMVATMDLWTLYLLAILSFGLLVALSWYNRIPQTERAGAMLPEKPRFVEVFSMIRGEPGVLVGIINMGIITLFLGGFNLLVLSYSEIQQDPGLMGWIYTVEGTSILLGGLLAKRWTGTRNLLTTSTLLIFVFAFSQLGMSFAEHRMAVLLSFALFGFTVAFFFPMVTTIFQRRLPDEAHGRFFSFKGMLDRVLFQLALLITGAGLDLFGLSWYMLLLASLTAFSALLTLLFIRRRAQQGSSLSDRRSAAG
ncbi:MFS transporter [Brevibacillus humidisoli]|uniref:MFS transporter n=1 Tax=Brevibacillus humidisoli TaxID=2895522 RepID=UPI001E2F7A29|nr:MFS transporter [Brevibacillus humidisoli]